MSATLVEFPKLEEAPLEAVPQEPTAIPPAILQGQPDFIRTRPAAVGRSRRQRGPSHSSYGYPQKDGQHEEEYAMRCTFGG